MNSVHTNRNSLCPCGSQKRYKHCCGAQGDLGHAPLNTDDASGLQYDLLLRAMDAQKRNDLDSAEKLYCQVLERSPDNIDALHMLGVVHFSRGQLALAEKYIRDAGSRCHEPLPAIEHNLRQVLHAATLRAESAAMRAHLESAKAIRDMGLDPLRGATLQSDARIIAFYLPQYHRIPENDEWWGDGFTEWVNVRRAEPNFTHHYQPHEPGELGYYDLNDEEVLVRQADLAGKYGITGFCYYYYWFSGRRLLNMPIDRLLRTGKPDFPYCLCWANENWTRNWDGGNREILVEQRYSSEDSVAFINALLPHFRDPRYMRVCHRPLLMVYRLDLLPDPKGTIQIWRDTCTAHGMPEPFVVMAATFGSAGDPRGLGADAVADFPPHGVTVDLSLHGQISDTRQGYQGRLADYLQTAAKLLKQTDHAYPYFPGLIPSWDNTARRQLDGLCLINSSPAAFEVWLRELVYRASQKKVPDERIIFVNAWNEWAEGCHLEPDQRYGRAWLEACANARIIPRDYKGLTL